MELQGILVQKGQTQNISDNFKKREFAIETSEQGANGATFTSYAVFQLMQDKCTVLDGYNVGDSIKVSFNIKGNKSEKDGVTRYFNNLSAWKIEKLGASQPSYSQPSTPAPTPSQSTTSPFGNEGDLPF